MVHALREVHRAIKPGGALLDIHPQPQLPPVHVLMPDGRAVAVGEIDWSSDNGEIRAARRRLQRLERDGLFRTTRRERFTLTERFESVDEWLHFREERGATSVVPPDTIERARRAMAEGGETVVVRLKARATILDRLNR